MISPEVITKIADGLRQVAQIDKVEGIYREDLKFFQWVADKNKDFYDFLDSPFIEFNEKSKVLDDMFKDLLVPEILSFVKILTRDRMVTYFPQIRSEFNRLADEDANILEGRVETPFELDQNQIRNLERAFSAKTGKKVILKQVNDPSLVAGLRVIIDSTSYEYSVKTVLDQTADDLKKRPEQGGENDGR